MKKILSSLLLLASTISALAQDYKQEITKDYLQYTEYIVTNQPIKAVKYLHDGLFKFIPKEHIIKGMESIYESDEMTFVFEDPEILDFSSVKKIDGIYYVIFQTTSNFQMKMKEITDEKDPQKKAMKISTIQIGFEEKFGRDHVNYSNETGFFRITSIKKTIANSKDQKDWKFTVIENTQQKKILEQFIPKELLD